MKDNSKSMMDTQKIFLMPYIFQKVINIYLSKILIHKTALKLCFKSRDF